MQLGLLPVVFYRHCIRAACIDPAAAEFDWDAADAARRGECRVALFYGPGQTWSAW